jgi:hypothetical protein
MMNGRKENLLTSRAGLSIFAAKIIEVMSQAVEILRKRHGNMRNSKQASECFERQWR